MIDNMILSDDLTPILSSSLVNRFFPGNKKLKHISMIVEIKKMKEIISKPR